jgi:tRNA pseudouridine65 synthase
LALVRGKLEGSGTVDSPIRFDKQSEYKEAKSIYKSLEILETKLTVNDRASQNYSIIELQPITGRTHQLRKHMSKISHPIVGDNKYGDRHHNHKFEELFGHTFLYLHAFSLKFRSISTNELVDSKASFPRFWENDLKLMDSECFSIAIKNTRIG